MASLKSRLSDLATAVGAAVKADRAAIALRAPLASPVFTGTPAAPTPVSTDDGTTIATTAFGQSLVTKSALAKKLGHGWGTQAERLALSGSDLFADLYWYETDTDNTYRYTAGAWVLWDSVVTAFTPTFTGLTLGNGSAQGWWQIREGRYLYFAFSVLFGSTTAVTGGVSVAPPNGYSMLALPNANFRFPLGQAQFYDNSAGQEYHGICTYGAATSIPLRVRNSAGTYETATNASATVPFTWAVNDQIVGEVHGFVTG